MLEYHVILTSQYNIGVLFLLLKEMGFPSLPTPELNDRGLWGENNVTGDST
jgi:hypothetical protein